MMSNKERIRNFLFGVTFAFVIFGCGGGNSSESSISEEKINSVFLSVGKLTVDSNSVITTPFSIKITDSNKKIAEVITGPKRYPILIQGKDSNLFEIKSNMNKKRGLFFKDYPKKRSYEIILETNDGMGNTALIPIKYIVSRIKNLPDLRIDSVTLLDSSGNEITKQNPLYPSGRSQKITFRFKVSNIGKGDIPEQKSYYIRFYTSHFDSKHIEIPEIGDLDPGGSTTFEFESPGFILSSKGNHQISISINYNPGLQEKHNYDIFKERNLKNNEIKTTLFIAPSDITPEDLSVEIVNPVNSKIRENRIKKGDMGINYTRYCFQLRNNSEYPFYNVLASRQIAIHTGITGGYNLVLVRNRIFIGPNEISKKICMKKIRVPREIKSGTKEYRVTFSNIGDSNQKNNTNSIEYIIE